MCATKTRETVRRINLGLRLEVSTVQLVKCHAKGAQCLEWEDKSGHLGPLLKPAACIPTHGNLSVLRKGEQPPPSPLHSGKDSGTKRLSTSPVVAPIVPFSGCKVPEPRAAEEA